VTPYVTQFRLTWGRTEVGTLSSCLFCVAFVAMHLLSSFVDLCMFVTLIEEGAACLNV